MSRVEIRTWEHSGEPRIVYGEPGMGCFLECIYTEPPSMKGRTVDVYVPPSVIPKLMQELRKMAIRDRR